MTDSKASCVLSAMMAMKLTTKRKMMRAGDDLDGKEAANGVHIRRGALNHLAGLDGVVE